MESTNPTGKRTMQTRTAGTWFDVVTFLSLAAALGLACGAAFGAIALLLAAA
jgi:hypothetical protein